MTSDNPYSPDVWGDDPDSPRSYPLDIRGDYPEGDLSRGLWLVKWLLAIPHIFILAFLLIAVAVVWVVAFFAVLITARYPRGLFDFTVGVMRWGWRVGFYAFSPVATDRYPPFSLQPDDEYPADLHVEYPERLSRAKALFKWWLLAIPHYLIIGIFVGSGSVLQGSVTNIVAGAEVLEYGQQFADEAAIGLGWQLIGTGLSVIPSAVGSTLGLMGALVIIALVTLLFRGRYPRDMFDFVLGINRWVNRVYGYALLLYDDYPPFRLSS